MSQTRWDLKLSILRSGTTQRAVAEAIGRDEVYMSRVVRGHIDPKPFERERIAELLGRPERDLF